LEKRVQTAAVASTRRGRAMSIHAAGHAHPFDSTPHLRAAGLGGGSDGESCEVTLKPELYNDRVKDPCPVPMQKWRKDMTPGRVILHPGVADDTDFQRLEIYGKAEPVGVKVHEVLNTAPKSMLLAKATAKKESIYLSHKREPLGKQYTRGHELPNGMGVTKGFGMPTPQEVGGDQTKHLMHPDERLVPEAERQLYITSHANYDPGEQRTRGYKWVDESGPIDPAQYRFGAGKEGEKAGVAKAMNPWLDRTYQPPPVVVEKLLEDHRELSAEALGKAKNLGFGKYTDPQHMFGVPSQSAPEWGVRECIGNYPPEEQQPDKDLGKSVRPGWRNQGPADRVFGVPSIRSDIAAPMLKSVADHQNYGDESGSGTLLYPPRFQDGGVSQADFLAATSQAELVDIFRSAGFDLSDEAAADAYARATRLDPNGFVSVQSFRMALNGEA